jgi:hypothetical protein
MIRQVLFSLPSRRYFIIVAFILKQMPDKLVEALHGQHSLKLLRPMPPI